MNPLRSIASVHTHEPGTDNPDEDVLSPHGLERFRIETASEKQRETIRELIREDCDRDWLDCLLKANRLKATDSLTAGETPLVFYAIQTMSVLGFDALLEAMRLEPNGLGFVDGAGNGLLHHIALSLRREDLSESRVMVSALRDCLRDNHADIDWHLRNHEGRTPFELASSRNDDRVSDWLSARCYDVHPDFAALENAIRTGDVDRFQALTQTEHFNSDAQNDKGDTVVHFLAEHMSNDFLAKHPRWMEALTGFFEQEGPHMIWDLENGDFLSAVRQMQKEKSGRTTLLAFVSKHVPSRYLDNPGVSVINDDDYTYGNGGQESEEGASDSESVQAFASESVHSSAGVLSDFESVKSISKDFLNKKRGRAGDRSISEHTDSSGEDGLHGPLDRFQPRKRP
jgi:hypothetical protein